MPPGKSSKPTAKAPAAMDPRISAAIMTAAALLALSGAWAMFNAITSM